MSEPDLGRRRRARLIVSALAVSMLLLAGCSSAGDGSRTHSPAAPQAAALPAAIPMPPGDWRPVFAGAQDLAYGTARRSIAASVQQGVIDRLVLVYSVQLARRYDFTSRANCQNPAYFHAEPGEHADGAGACWHVHTVNLGLAGDPHWVNGVLAGYAQQNDLYLPVAMVGVRFIRYAEGRLLQVDYLWNPDLLLPPPAGSIWYPDDWSSAAIGGSPAKRVVMETLQQWGERWQPRIAAAFAVSD